ncbi:HAD family hydrolase [Proteiniclasticum sp. QWL-01]|uniref:HAD family hydrolase n=1 Tax=Proteiniclasticum sp. QWL-01 TaxID=3036945 RepID=UPI002410EE03|nr:HAD family hydrolase [Proteiniclasticum sp. QWL-01]WFF73215.1 HAD family hydrolase [Proteiniclasticum sp. QWL-01]
MDRNSQKLICFDLDGTLLDRSKQVSSENLEILRRVTQAGHIVSIATGRLYKSACKIRHLIPTPVELICSNGAVIERDGRIIRMDQIPPDQLEDLYDLTHFHNLTLSFDSLYKVYHTSLGWALRMAYFSNIVNKGSLTIQSIHVRSRNEYMKYAGFYINGIVISNNHPDRLQALRRDLEAMGRFNIESSAASNVEIIPKFSNKGSAAQILALSHGIAPENIIAFGDGENDLKLIQTAGIGFAMGNACDLLKDSANYVIGDHTTDAIAKTLRELLDL